jgi:hypothetical protein
MIKTNNKNRIDQARINLLAAIPHFKNSVDQAKQSGDVQLGVLSYNEDHSGKIIMSFDCEEFFEDLAVLTTNPWQDIANAPKDRVILTNEGTACFVEQRNWGSPVINGWYLCPIDGNILTCADDGMSISSIQPKRWMDIPKDTD